MRTTYIVGMIVLLCAMMVVPASAETWYVHPTDPDGTVYYTMEHASPGDTIFFYNGTYYLLGVMGTESIFKPNITWEGEGADVVTLVMQNRAIIMEAPGCVFEEFTIVDTDLGTRISAPDCIVRNCVFDRNKVVAQLFADNITFENNIGLDASGPHRAIEMYYSNCTVRNNTIVNSTGGFGAIQIAADPDIGRTGANNIIVKNNIINNTYGISLNYAGEGNEIYLNNFIDNGVDITQSTAYWNSPEPIEYIYNGATYTSHLGNYWSDYTGTDDNGDGIGDSSYTIKKAL